VSTTAIQTDRLIGIKKVVLHRVRIPFVEPFRISNGVVAEKESILVEAETDEGIVGWGEASPMTGTFYSADTPESCWQSLKKELIPRLLELGAFDPAQLYKQLRRLPAPAFAKAGVEGAVWDAFANTKQTALCDLFGIARRAVSSGVAIGIFDTVDELLERVQRYVAQGYRRVKIKIQPGWDIDPVSAVRARFPEVDLMVDANAAYTIADEGIFRELDRFGLMMIEQPLPAYAIDEAGELQAMLQTRLCADESAESLASVERLVEKQAARIINIKVQRVGGLSEALLMLSAARAADLECWVGTMPELGIASGQALHLAMHEGFSFPTDVEASRRWYVDDIVEPLIEIDADGFINVPPGMGMGYSVLREKVDRYSTARERFVS
jgi:o-succinylbenzoate synthase